MFNPQEILQRRKSFDTNLCEAYYAFCVKFGWISPEEFKMIPLPTFFGLATEMKKESDLYEKQRNKIKKPRRR